MPLQISRMVAFGTKADMPLTPVNVRFRRQSGNWRGLTKCPLLTQSGHQVDRLAVMYNSFRPPFSRRH
jgi:hypothetical protein